MPAVNPLYAYYWSLNAQTTDEAKKNAASKFVGYLSSEPGEWLKNVDFIQPVVGWASQPEAAEFKFGEVWEGEMSQGQFMPVLPQGEEVDNIVMQAIELSILSGVEPQEAFDWRQVANRSSHRQLATLRFRSGEFPLGTIPFRTPGRNAGTCALLSAAGR